MGERVEGCVEGGTSKAGRQGVWEGGRDGRGVGGMVVGAGWGECPVS